MATSGEFDLTLRNGRISIGIRYLPCRYRRTRRHHRRRRAGPAAARPQDIDAGGRWVLPGGIDSHCHVEQLSGMGVMCADDFYSATVSAAFGGTTTIIPSPRSTAATPLPEVVADYHRRAAEKAVIDYGFHLILSDPTETRAQARSARTSSARASRRSRST